MKWNTDSRLDGPFARLGRKGWLVGLTSLLLCSCQTMHSKVTSTMGTVGMPRAGQPQVAGASTSRQDAPVVSVPGESTYAARVVGYEAPAGAPTPAGFVSPSAARPGHFPAGYLPAGRGPYSGPGYGAYSPALPRSAWTGVPMHAPCGGGCGSPGCSSGSAGCGRNACGCGMEGECPPYRPEEFVCDGGDQPTHVTVGSDWSVQGLDPEDTVVHFDTRQGDTQVVPSNRVCIYAPKFGAVRRVSCLLQHEQHERGAAYENPVQLGMSGTAELATTVIQPVAPKGKRSTTFDQSFRERTRTVGLENRAMPAATEDQMLPFEDLLVLQNHQLDGAQKARLSEHLQAAIAWTHDKAVQVVIDNMVASEASGHVGAEAVYSYELPIGKPRIRITKVASTQEAHSGELVEFTIRIDNIGDDVVGNVTVIDNLTTRLEYVPDSQKCSLKGDFIEDTNAVESLTLRWEITEPLKVGEGGTIRFRCRVR